MKKYLTSSIFVIAAIFYFVWSHNFYVAGELLCFAALLSPVATAYYKKQLLKISYRPRMILIALSISVLLVLLIGGIRVEIIRARAMKIIKERQGIMSWREALLSGTLEATELEIPGVLAAVDRGEVAHELVEDHYRHALNHLCPRVKQSRLETAVIAVKYQEWLRERDVYVSLLKILENFDEELPKTIKNQDLNFAVFLLKRNSR